MKKSNNLPKPMPKKLASSANIKSKKKRQIFHLSSDYTLFSITILLLTTLFWAYLGAKIQNKNADQLVNSYLFESSKTFHSAMLPSAHTFLIKWPLFLAIRLAGLSANAFIAATVFLCEVTVAALAYILYRIDSRPAVFGTMCLCLASVLLLVPPQPYAGGILPVNMAMLATRNIEYIIYIVGLVLIIRAHRLRDWNFVFGILVLGLLSASDKLFLTFSLGGAGLSLVAYVATRRWVLVRLSARWLVASLLAAVLAVGLLSVINDSGLTHIVGSANSSPYALIKTFRSFGLGIVFGALGTLTNFGANPAFDAAVLRNIPNLIRDRVLGAGGISFIVNGIIFLIGISLSVKLYVSSFHRPTAKEAKTDNPTKLAVMMLSSSIIAIGAFVLSDHYFVVDARYLSILLFTVFISVAVVIRKRQALSIKPAVLAGLMVIFSVLLGIYSTYGIYIRQNEALADIDQRNNLVVQALASHKIDILVGDYWRAIPIKTIQPNIQIDPLEDCTHERAVLSSKNWQNDLKSHSFAYLVSFDKSLTNYPSCGLVPILATYGRPNSSVLISGTIEKPQELVLFYDQGITKSVPQNVIQTVLPLNPDQIPAFKCQHTIMNIVAHEDDDLLFLSPDLMHDVLAQSCIRTIYMTAGDSGNSQLYWLSRERGSEAAYSKLINSDVPWVQHTIKMAENQFVTVSNPRGNTNVSLIFMHLPDGSPTGRGFQNSYLESLELLEANRIPAIHSVDKQSSYSSEQLSDVLVQLMRIYQPSEIHAQAPSNPYPQSPDHSDHMAVGRFATKAYNKYGVADLPIKYYLGYSIKRLPANVFGNDLDAKTAAFLAYGQYDPATCHIIAECYAASSYGAYLDRQYALP